MSKEELPPSQAPQINDPQVPSNDEQQPPPPGPSQQIVYVTQPTTVPFYFGKDPVPMTCQFCHTEMTTSVKVKPNTKTHLVALCLCCVCWPCVWVPYCMDSCQSKKHYCSHCNQFLGAYSD